MGLNGERAVAIDKGRVFAKRIGPDPLRPFGQRRHLIAVPGIHGQHLTVEIVFRRPDGPAAVIALHLAAKRLRDDLVAKADADQRHLRGIGAADEILQGLDEGMILIGAVARPGDEPAVAIMDVGRELHLLHQKGAKGQAPVGEKPREHVRVVARGVLEDVGGLSGLENADLHDRLLVGLRKA